MGIPTYRVPTAEELPNTLTRGTKTIATAGSEAAIAASTPCRGVYIRALDANTGYVYWGDSAVSSTVYVERLAAGEGTWIGVSNLALIYIDVSVNGEGVTFGYLSDV